MLSCIIVPVGSFVCVNYKVSDTWPEWDWLLRPIAWTLSGGPWLTGVPLPGFQRDPTGGHCRHLRKQRYSCRNLCSALIQTGFLPQISQVISKPNTPTYYFLHIQIFSDFIWPPFFLSINLLIHYACFFVWCVVLFLHSCRSTNIGAKGARFVSRDSLSLWSPKNPRLQRTLSSEVSSLAFSLSLGSWPSWCGIFSPNHLLERSQARSSIQKYSHHKMELSQ